MNRKFYYFLFYTIVWQLRAFALVNAYGNSYQYEEGDFRDSSIESVEDGETEIESIDSGNEGSRESAFEHEDGVPEYSYLRYAKQRYSPQTIEEREVYGYKADTPSREAKRDSSAIDFGDEGTGRQDNKVSGSLRYSPARQFTEKIAQWPGPPLFSQASSKPQRPPPMNMAMRMEMRLNEMKPASDEWVLGRDKSQKLNLISWLIDGCYFYTNSSKVQDILNKAGFAFEKCSFANNPANNVDNDSEPSEFQTFDGFFNNPFKVDLGAVDTPLLRRVPPVYTDGVYDPVKGDRINPFHASKLMERKLTCKDRNTKETTDCGSKTGKTAFLVYFGQQVVEEILDAQRAGCPPEYFNVDIPEDHEFHKNKTVMPFLRTRWAQKTGQSPGNPRQQLNEITPWIDGGLIYGTAKGWADVLRTRPDGSLVEHGLLASDDDKGYFPARNKLRLPLANPPPPANHSDWIKKHETAKVERFFVLGNPRGNENAFLLSFGVVLFRWHNLIATYLHDSRPKWSGERIFQEARKWVIATHQHLVMYDWLPEWLGETMDKYAGYDPSIDPQIEQFFQTAAMRFGHTLVTPGAYMRDYACAGCKPLAFPGLGNHRDYPKKDGKESFGLGAVRTCNIFWRPQEPLELRYTSHECLGDNRTFADIDRLLMGMASQKAEREDNAIVDDLRGRVFGPLEFSRRDLMAVNIQRGRDHGTPDYNTAREAFGLDRITSVSDYILKTGTSTPEGVLMQLEEMHKAGKKNNTMKGKYLWDNIDVWTGGILETSYRPGPLFRAIIKDQFYRIRSADRFWFENQKWKKKRFSPQQIQRIKLLKIFDVVVSVTKMLPEDIQENPFRVPDETFKKNTKPQCFNETENPYWETGYCLSYNGIGTEVPANFTCYHFPQLHSKENPVENCTELGTYDYFDGSEVSFILTYVAVGFIIIGIGALVPLVASFRQKKKEEELAKGQKKLKKSYRFAGIEGVPLSATEWLGSREGTRSVVMVLKDSGCLEIRSHKGELFRMVDFANKPEIDMILVTEGKYLIIKHPKEYDCVFAFDSKYLRQAFINLLNQKLAGKTQINTQTASLHQSLASAVTKDKRLRKLENFFKIVFAQAFALDQPKGEEDLLDPKLIREVISTELTRSEFSSALGMKTGSQFVEKMFDLIDRDKNGYISFREFLDMLVVFAKGTAEDKARLMFEMYDISRTGALTSEEFKSMIKSMVEAANADVNDDDVERMTQLMLNNMGLKRDSKVTLQSFHKLMSEHKDTLGYAQLNFSGVNVPESQAKSSRKSRLDTARNAIVSIYGGESPTVDPGKPAKDFDRDSEEVTITDVEPQGALSKWIELYRLQIFWGTLYTLVVLVIFLERAFVYSFEKEHAGLRHIAGYGVTVTRGAASVIMFTYATLLLTMCRNSITRLRETFLHLFIPFDSSITLHKYAAIIGLIFSCIHIIGHSINFYHISTQTSSDLSCLFRDYHRPTHVLPKFHYWCFQTLTGFTGVLLVIHAALIYAFATNYARTHAFRMFWITHATYPIWYILMLLHGSGRLVQEPLFFNFLCLPLVIFVLDCLLSASRNKVEIPVIRAEILPSNVTKLEFARPTGFEYKSGQWVRIASAALNPNEFHPFTLSSAPHEPHLSLHIRAVGPFTSNIRQIYELSLPKLYLDGPYGEGHQDWWRYEVAVLVGGGIGVTPFASILKDVATNAHPRNCKKIYFLWVTRTQKQFEWMVDIIRDVEEHKLISVHVFITQIYNKFDLRTVLLYIFERHFQRVNGKSLFTGLKSVTHFGRPNFKSFFQGLQSLHPNVLKFGVFSCGPYPMTKTVDEACLEVNNLTDGRGTVFQHHFENF